MLYGESALTQVAPDTSRVQSFLREYLTDSIRQANAQTADILRRCQTAAAQYEITRTAPNSRLLAESLDHKLKVNESADQIDDITALHMDIFMRDGQFARVDPGPMSTQVRAQVVNQALTYEFACGKVAAQLERATRHYAVFPIAGFKSVREFKDGYNRYYFRHINPQCLLLSDVGRTVSQQFSMHEVHFFTKREMQRAGFKNLDKLGTPDGKGRNTILASASRATTTKGGNSVTGNQTHEIYESWAVPPFLEQLLTPAELAAWVNEWGLPPQAFQQEPDADNFLRVYHNKEGVVVKVTPNYLATPKEHPYRLSSYHDSLDESAAGNSQAERSSDLYSAHEMLVNNWFTNLQMQGNQSCFIARRAGINEDQLQKLYKPRGIVPIPGNENPNEIVMPWQPGDISQPSMLGIQWVESKIQQNGVNDVMRGMSSARTATESRNDNARGQMMVDSTASRFVRDCILPATLDVMRMIVTNYTPDDWIRTNGERGSVMIGQPPMTVEEIDNHFVIAPVATFDFMNQTNQILELANLANVFGAFLMPDQGQRSYEVALSKTRLPRNDIEYIMGSKGDYTKVEQEIQAMLVDPWGEIEVKMSDDHQLAIAAVMMTAQGNPMTGKMPLPEFLQYPAVMAYLEKHQMFLMAQMQMQAAMQDAKARTPNGNPKQMDEGSPPDSDESNTRSQGQQASPTNQSMPGNVGNGAMLG